jgi:hypothetical protein
VQIVAVVAVHGPRPLGLPGRVPAWAENCR